MKQIIPSNARSFPTEHAHSGTLPLIRVTFFPCTACLILNLLLLTASILAEALGRLKMGRVNIVKRGQSPFRFHSSRNTSRPRNEKETVPFSRQLISPLPTCSSSAAQGQAQPSSPSSQEFLVSHLESRAMRFSVSFFTFFTLLAFFTTTSAETFVSGEVSGVWDVDGSPYLVTDTLIVPEGDTLLIEPGVTVEFQDQTDSTRTPWYVNGTLLALGEEGDSIRIQSQPYAFDRIISTAETEGTLIHCEYVVIDSAYIGIESQNGTTIVRHSRIVALRNQVCMDFDSGEITHCTLLKNEGGTPTASSTHMSDGGPYEFHDNYAPNVTLGFSAPQIDSIYRVTGYQLRLLNCTTEIYDCAVDIYYLNSGDYHVHDLASGCVSHETDITADQSSLLIENSLLKTIYMMASSGVIRHNELFGHAANYFMGTIHLNTCAGVEIYNNVIDSTATAISMSVSEAVDIRNNTLLGQSRGIYIANTEEVSIRNNVLQGDGVDCIGIDAAVGAQSVQAAYNCLYNFSEAVDNVELDSTSMITNPFLGAGVPFDYTLQANSPCIDAGDPASPNDPDGTRADIGGRYYDQSIDNPPVQTIPENVFARTGHALRIEITATDDNGPFDFTFPDLPEWLSEEDELDWVSDTTAVSGTVPEDAEDFSFTVVVEDGEGQTDSSIVMVTVDVRTILQGEISGILHVEDSPFYVVEDIIVPEGDSLIIEPGCELQFRYVEDEEQRSSITIYGTVIAEGTVQDSINFTMANEEAVFEGWQGIQLLGPSDTTRFSYTNIHFADWAIHADSSSFVVISNANLSDLGVGIVGWNGSTILVRTSRFFSSDSVRGYTAVSISQSSQLEIDSCCFIDRSSPSELSPIRIAGSTAIITNCVFEDTKWISADLESSVQIRNNIFNRSYGYYSISDANNATAKICNNLFIGSDSLSGGGIWTRSPADTIRNNVFYGLNNAIHVVENYSGGPSASRIEGNVFINCGSSILDDPDDGLLTIQYNVFFENDSIDSDLVLDETNLLIAPEFADSLFYLYNTSPLIDAGPPSIELYDVDSTRNDIGIWGGPYGRSYEYPLWIRERPIGLPNKFMVDAPYPNPFNSTQNIHIALPEKSELTLKLYNILGQLVFIWDFSILAAGYHHITYTASELASGMYFLEIRAGKEVERKRVVLLK